MHANVTNGISMKIIFVFLTVYLNIFVIDFALCDLIQLLTFWNIYISSNIYAWCKALPNISDFPQVEASHANGSIYL